MPLLDHFHSPVAPRWQWGSIHSAWAVAITEQLNTGVLPPDYFAQPHTQLSNEFEVDVATLKTTPQLAGTAGASGAWQPPPADESVPIDFPHWQSFEVQVFQDLDGGELRAAIELVSPANKDRPENRETFSLKCATYLEHGVSLAVIDVVTGRLANMHEELLRVLRLPQTTAWQSPTHLAAIAYRVVRANGQRQLEIWQHALAIGSALPTLPLWLEPDLCVPLRLEDSYTRACSALRLVG